ncbi:iron-containing redox enzyme family protein [Candidatus Peregrinibacteria bacterium]|nr:iron-containing redox enzyme family protein [Candidatus Peregrinibacteria bacterium]
MNLSQFDSLIASRSLLKHPFYQKWSKGELTLNDMQVYAKEYFHLVERIPGIVARVRDRAQDRRLKDQIDENVREEQEHVELWKRFAKSVGVTEQELRSYVPSMTVQKAVASLEETAERSFSEGVVAVYALELELPKIAETKKDGLCRFYGLENEDAQIYFDEHLKEEKHLGVWRAMPIEGSTLKQAAERSLTAQNQVLDGVCEKCGISMVC